MAAVSLGYGAILWAQQPETTNPTSDSSASVNSTALAPAGSTVVPRLISFSGTLKDVDSPAEEISVTFSLYSVPDGGSPLWAESQKVNLDSQGHYTVMLGAASPKGLPLDLFTSGKALWLRVQPPVEGAAEQPRVLLVAVPYALKAADADTLGGKPAAAYVLQGAESSGVVAVPPNGLQPPAAKAQSQTQTSQTQVSQLSPCSSITSDGTATANSIAMFTAPCNIEKSPISVAGGNVGIGTKSPISPLTVAGHAEFDAGGPSASSGITMRGSEPLFYWFGNNGAWQMGFDALTLQDFFLARVEDEAGNAVTDTFYIHYGAATAKLTSGVSVGATSLNLSTALTMGTYNTILIGTISGGNQEVLRVSAGSGTTKLTTSPTQYAHPSGSLVTVLADFNHLPWTQLRGSLFVSAGKPGYVPYVPGVSSGLISSGVLAHPTAFANADQGQVHLTTPPVSASGIFTKLTFGSPDCTNDVCAAIGMVKSGGGTSLEFGTSNNNAAGVTNTALTIDPSGNLTAGANLAVRGTLSAPSLSAGTVVAADGPIRGNNGDGSVVLQDGLGNEVFRGLRASTAWSDGKNASWFETGNAADYIAFTAQNGTPATRMGLFSSSTQVSPVVGGNAPAGLFEISNGTRGLLNVLPSGNVGIGTTSPSATLEVNGTAKFNRPANFAGLISSRVLAHPTVFANTDQGQATVVTPNTTSGDFAKLTFGNWGCANNVCAAIGMHPTPYGSYLEFGTSNNYAAGVTNTALTIDYSGSVGIGTTTPRAMLEVNGTAK
ncbi:MAG: hypothetical protein DMG27_08775, partial [Acidobacteria bacterium]